jgi:hypothetical protein
MKNKSEATYTGTGLDEIPHLLHCIVKPIWQTLSFIAEE